MDTIRYSLSLSDGATLGTVNVPQYLRRGDELDYDGKSYIVIRAKIRAHGHYRNILDVGYAVVGHIGMVEKEEDPVDYLSLPLNEARAVFERGYLVRQVARFGGNISQTASFVGMERSALHRKLVTLEVGKYADNEFEQSRMNIALWRNKDRDRI